MLAFVPFTRRPPSPSQPRVWAGWFCAGLLALCGCSTATTTTSTNNGVSGGITVTITTLSDKATTLNDKALAAAATGTITVGGTVSLAGTFALDPGVTLNKTAGIQLAFGDKNTSNCNVSGSKFTCSVDTTMTDKTTGAPLAACNESVTLSVIAAGTLAGNDVGGTGNLDVEVDNCSPGISLVALPEPVPPAVVTEAVFVGTQQISVIVKDNRLQSASLDITDEDGNSILPQPMAMPVVDGSPPPTTWKFVYTLDTTALSKTEELTLTVTAQDLSNDPTQATLAVFSVKSAAFLGQENDKFSKVINDFVIPDPTIVAATAGFVGFTSAPTPTSGGDTLLDVVVAAEDGVYIRAGLPKRDPQGNALDAQGATLDGNANTIADGTPSAFAHSLQFEELVPADALYKTRVIRGTADEVKAGALANMSRVFLRDLDGDGDLDILAVGTVTGPAGTFGEVWAILNVPDTYTYTGADSKPVTQTLRAFKIVDTLQLPARPSTAEMADLNGDSLDDLLFGAIKTQDANGQDLDLGLMTLLLTQGPICTVTDDPATPQKSCKDETVNFAGLKSAKVFGDVKVAPNMGVTAVVSIATGDFWDGGGLDVCVGSGNRPIVSCYRNVKGDGTLNQAVDAYQFKDGTDTSLILQVNLPPTLTGGKSGPDLLVASTTGSYLRWLRTNHAGQFSFVEDSAAHRDIPNVLVQAMTVANIGPTGNPYVLAGLLSGEVDGIPLDPTDDAYELACFRAWMIGGVSIRIAAADVDGDGVLDLLNARRSPSGLVTDRSGIQIALGQAKFKGSFIAPTVHHICAEYAPATARGVQHIAAAKVVDFDKDKKNELLVIGVQSSSSAIGALGNLNGNPMPIWPMAVFMNVGGQLNPEPRQGEFSPYNPGSRTAAGFTQDLTNGAPLPFGSVVAAALGDVDEDGLPDLVTVRSASAYAVGTEVPAGDCGCVFAEQNEISNGYGEDGPSGTDANPAVCCSNFGFADTNKTSPIFGFGGTGAPMNRASAHVFLSSKTGPLGLAAKCNWLPSTNICNMTPAYALSGGRNPLDVQLVDVDGDKALDIVTAMDNDGVACFKTTPDKAPFLAARVRLFKNDTVAQHLSAGKAHFTAQFLGDDKATPRDKIELQNCDDKHILSPSIVSYRVMPDGLAAIVAAPWPNPVNAKLDPVTIFGLGTAYGQIGILPHMTGFTYAKHATSPIGGTPNAFEAADINNDSIADMLVLSNSGSQLAILTGKVNDTGGKDAAFDTQTVLSVISPSFSGAVAAAMGDVNHDSNLDLVLLGKGDSASILFLLGTGHGTFVPFAGSAVGVNPVALEIADMDGDGCVDIVVRSQDSVTIIQNEGTASGECAQALLWTHASELAAIVPTSP